MDRTYFAIMKKRILHVNEVPSKYIKEDTCSSRWELKSGTLKKFSPADERMAVPDLKYDLIRGYASGQYATDLFDQYLEF